MSSAKAKEPCRTHEDVIITSLRSHCAGGVSSCETTCIAYGQALPIS